MLLSRVRTAQQSQTQSLSLAQFWTCRWAVQICLFTSSFIMLDGSFERKSSNENKNAMENLQLTHDLGSLQSQKPVSGMLPVQQRRNEVRWRPGQEASLAPPCSNLRSFENKYTVLKNALVILLRFSAPPAVIWRPGNEQPCPPRYATAVQSVIAE